MKISAKWRYAVRSVINLSKSPKTQKSVREVANEEDISLNFLEKIFTGLKKGGIISSSRGAKGGFSLAKEPNEISILEILTAIGEDINPTPCGTDKCLRDCDIAYFWNMTKEQLAKYYSEITIEDIIERKVNGE